MKTIALAATCAVLVAAVPAQAQDNRTLEQFLSSCNIKATDCRLNLHDYIYAADTQGMICMPKDMSLNEAVDESLDWLRRNGQDPALANGNAEDGEWTAISTLFPCKNG